MEALKCNFGDRHIIVTGWEYNRGYEGNYFNPPEPDGIWGHEAHYEDTDEALTEEEIVALMDDRSTYDDLLNQARYYRR